jgi:hypothetical protein
MQAYESTPRPSRRARAAPSSHKGTVDPSNISRNTYGQLFSSAAPKAFPYSPPPPSSPPFARYRTSPVRAPTRLRANPVSHAEDVAYNNEVATSDDPFGFFAAERKFAHIKPPSTVHARKPLSRQPQPAPAVTKPSLDTEYDSDEALYASRSGTPTLDLFPTLRHNRITEPVPPSLNTPSKKPSKRARATTPASSILSSPPVTPQKQMPPRQKRMRTAGKENPPDEDENEASPRSSEPPRSPLVAKRSLRKGTRVATAKSRAQKQPAHTLTKITKSVRKSRKKHVDSDDSGGDSDAEPSEEDEPGHGIERVVPHPRTAAYKAERQARIAYFQDVDDYQFETENVYVV